MRAALYLFIFTFYDELGTVSLPWFIRGAHNWYKDTQANGKLEMHIVTCYTPAYHIPFTSPHVQML